ncbi:GNAT family N-acetyltransferase [Salinibacterium sp. dk2585]|uniref:GNAT family N-acetyltransferase n=1 Tax=unclassified Salinibacterium TaxID=2632331 RepID=UPI0011C247A1|nr:MULTISPECIES: GNAT family N-acetyltransferase [unclassified Salinibacterium]QEE60138.1 GNAT family N-acetyltransferase [Salinibacterium sp. dk2585]TXK55210.1 GNAT family N-acetyltransferase [Salinibacterium sp. dk5596]
MTRFSSPRKLQKSDRREGFSSGAPELDDWFVRFAWENQAANNATTYVTYHGERVAGFYSVTMAAVAQDNAPERLAARRPTQIPCILLARLAVDTEFKGNGLGWSLLRDALRRAYQISESIGAAAVLVHCRDEGAKSFYLYHGDFLQSPVEELHLMVPMKALRRYAE